MFNSPIITEQKVKSAEEQIQENQKRVEYNTLEYPIEVLVDKYLNDEIFTPNGYQNLSWDDDHRSNFIEYIVLGLPIPYIIVVDVSQEEDDARLEVIDGTQRIRTIVEFLNNDLTLCNLKKLTELNGFKFQDLLNSRQRRFKRNTVRLVQLTPDTAKEFRQHLF
ncbi:DUF262 domain-containing protein [Lyngbya sp. PCC 8106]|uniref:DUF262 domain-containing protein n=1 Tax=Lyngbya sp. (strain PCC 8106) TaxID=313612 RepID=UPI0000EA9908|nr:DUF262 domain-containing protein [Lyngbya sp. PCC 8106]EAW35209.1 hypothetical protein L8106_13880 [Lyngbya sp. PCC 8106]